MKTLTRPVTAAHDALALGHNSQAQADQRAATVAQRQTLAAIDSSPRQVAQRQQQPNRTGLPDALKAGVESLSGHSLDDVQVHYNSAQPAQLQAHAYAQGTDIHLAPGQEKHLPHEAWHVAQQKQGRVRPTMQLKGVNVNDNAGLEQEATHMGHRAATHRPEVGPARHAARVGRPVAQRAKRTATTQGTHGFKRHEQKRLKRLYGINVNGRTHESEHAIGYEPISRGIGAKRGTRGRARTLENRAPAYQEVRRLHRDHIGTGSRGTVGRAGFNAKSYRRAQRRLLKQGRPSDAVQINQLGYAHDPAFRAAARTPEGQAATNSYNAMVTNMQGVTYAHGNQDVATTVTPLQQAEMYLSRQMAINKRYPTNEERAAARAKFKVDTF